MKFFAVIGPAGAIAKRLLAIACLLTLAACGGGGGTFAVVPMFSTMPAAVTLTVGEAPTYTVGGGTAPYTANSSNLNVAAATVSGATLTITGKVSGTSTVTVFDATGKSLGTVATVGSSAAAAPFFVTAPEAVTVPLSTATSYAISGGVGPYTASSSNEAVALVSVNGTSLSIVGLATGVAQVSIFDAMGETKVVNVTVGSGNSAFALFTTVPGTVTLGVADKPVYTTVFWGKVLNSNVFVREVGRKGGYFFWIFWSKNFWKKRGVENDENWEIGNFMKKWVVFSSFFGF